MEKSSFFNSVNGDRKYKASDLAEYFNSFISNGVFPNPSINLQVLNNNDMTITLKSGKAWINGYVYINTDDLVLNIDVADGVLNRIDRIVLRYDTVNRNITAKVKKGTFASAPTAPDLQRDADVYELGLADIAVNAGATSISQSNITDQRQNSDLCGIVNSLITVDSITLFNQFTDAFNTWFAGIKNTLDSDVAGNLLNQINDLAGSGRTTETVKGNADAIASHLADYANLLNNIIRTVKMEKSNKDSNGIYTQVDYKREDETLYMRSVLSEGTSPQYTTRTITIYDIDGTTVLQTITHTLSYDSDGNLISEV